MKHLKTFLTGFLSLFRLNKILIDTLKIESTDQQAVLEDYKKSLIDFNNAFNKTINENS